MKYQPRTKHEANERIGQLLTQIENNKAEIGRDVSVDVVPVFILYHYVLQFVAQWRMTKNDSDARSVIVDHELLRAARKALRQVKLLQDHEPKVSVESIMREIVHALYVGDGFAVDVNTRRCWKVLVGFAPKLRKYDHILTPAFVKACNELFLQQKEIQHLQEVEQHLPEVASSCKVNRGFAREIEREKSKPTEKRNAPPLALTPSEIVIRLTKEGIRTEEWKSHDHWRKSKTSGGDAK